MDKIVIIMAGGNSKRMNSNIPKVLMVIDNEPMIVKIVKECLKIDLQKILIVVGVYEELIKECIKKYIPLNKIEFIRQEPQLGTAHALTSCLPVLNKIDDNVSLCILSGDCPLITSQTINKFFDDCIVKIGITNLTNPTGYGRIVIHEKSLEIIEEKDCTILQKNIKTVNSGIYTFKNYILKQYLPLIDNNNNQKEYYLTSLFSFIEMDKITFFNFDKYIQHEMFGINTPEELNKIKNFKQWDYDPPWFN